MNKINYKKIGRMSFWVILSALLQAFALVNFSLKAGIYPSGVMGLARLTSDILRDFLNINFPYFFLYVVINLFLVILVYKHIGKLFAIFSMLQIVLVSLFSSIMKPYYMVDDMMLLAIFGGLINGAGVGLALQNGASSGGTDFLSIYYSNKYHKSMWNYNFAFNCILIVIAGLLYGWPIAAYSIIYQYMSNFMVRRMHRRYTHKAIIIVTEKPDAVIDAIFSSVRHGITKIEAKGAYNNSERTVLYTVVNSFETSEVIKCALKGDPDAFIETRDTLDVYGNYYQKPLD